MNDILKGYYSNYGYIGIVNSDKKMEFATESEYVEYMKGEDEEDV